MKKFWNFIRNDAGERILRLEGPIDEDDFWGDEITPKAFREELEAEDGNVTVWINSPGGNVFAAAQIYTMLCDHKGEVTVKIDAIAASAASVIAMAGDRVLMSPVAMLMVHDPMTIAMGNAKDMEKAISTLNEVKASIINAYQKKTGLSRNKISQLMENETWMNAKKAVELGFADEILFAQQDKPEQNDEQQDKPEPDKTEEEKDDGKEIKVEAEIKEWQPYSTRIMGQTILDRLVCAAETEAEPDEEPVDAEGDKTDVEPSEAGLTEPVAPVCDEAKPKGKPDESDEDDPDDPDEDDEPDEKRGTAKAEDKGFPVIGLDGRTADGAMPYELLKKQLDFLK